MNETAKIKFKSKVTTKTDGNGITRKYIRVPGIKKNHCDMHKFRTCGFLSPYANSDFFDGMINNHINKILNLDDGRLLSIDNLPEIIEATPIGDGYFYNIVINVPL